MHVLSQPTIAFPYQSNTIVLALGYVPENGLLNALKEKGIHTVPVGDAVKVSKIVTAIYQDNVLANDN